jgi:hypothetical protein
MPYFHASRNVYPIRHVIRVPAGETSHAYQLSLNLGKQWREEGLEAGRGGRAFSRETAVYAANTPGNAARFLISHPDPENRPIRVFEVDIPHESPSPMVLIGYIDDQGQDFPRFPECVEEYWAATKNWRFLEFVCPEMTVTADLGILDEMELYASGEHYEHDRALARHLWGLPPNRSPLSFSPPGL